MNIEGLRPALFAFPGPLRDRLVAAILRGEKTATSALLVDHERDGEPLPRVGERTVVLDSTGRPVAVIETTEVRVLRVADCDLAFARDEGEGFETVAAWRAAHEAFWASYADEVRAWLRDQLTRLASLAMSPRAREGARAPDDLEPVHVDALLRELCGWRVGDDTLFVAERFRLVTRT